MSKGDLAQMLTIAKYQFLNYLRSKRLYILTGIILAISAIFLIIIQVYIDPSSMNSNDFISQWVTFVPTVVILAALFFGGDAIAGEYGNKTGYFLFPNPIKRWSIFWGKFLASLTASTIVVMIYWAMALGDTYVVKGEITTEALYSLALSLLYLLSLMALTFMFSSFFKNSAVSITVVAILYFFVFGIVSSIAMFTGVEPVFSITYASGVIENVLQIPYPQHIQEIPAGDMKFTIFNVPLYTGIWIMVAYFFISGIIGTLVITYREVK